MTDEQTTEELRALQLERELTEQQLARSTAERSEVAQHERRANKARYLRKKLEDRGRSEREAAEGINEPPTGDVGG